MALIRLVSQTMNYLAVVMASYLCAYLLFLFCEAPVATLERTFLGGTSRRPPPLSQANPVTVKNPESGDLHQDAIRFRPPSRSGSPHIITQGSRL